MPTSAKKKNNKPVARSPSEKSSLPFSGPDKYQLNEEGLIKSWSASCRDGIELKIYVENDCCAGLTPTQVRTKFPQFMKYTYGSFNSAFQNIKKQANAQQHNQSKVTCKYILFHLLFLNRFLTLVVEFNLSVSHTITVSGLAQYNNSDKDEDYNEEEDSYAREDNDQSFTSKIASVSSRYSRLSVGDETMRTRRCFKTTNTGYKLILYMKNQASPKEPRASSRRKSRTVYGAKKAELPFVIDTWNNKNARRCCSVQVQCLSGSNPIKTHMFCVLTDRLSLVLSVVLSKSGLNVEKAFHYILAYMTENERQFLSYHTKLTARQLTVAKLSGRDPEKQLILEQRIPLPFACHHDFADKSNDPYFYGIKFVPYESTGETWAHIELVQEITDGYVGRKNNGAVILDRIPENIADIQDDNEANFYGQAVEDEDEVMSHKSSVSHKSDKSRKSARTTSSRKSASYTLSPSNVTPVGTPKKSNKGSPCSEIQVAHYPPLVSDTCHRRVTRSVCSQPQSPLGSQTKGKYFQKIVSHLPSDPDSSLVVYKDKSGDGLSYDGKITHGNVKRACRNQED